VIVNVWDRRANVKVASNKVSAEVKTVYFAENGNYFVTVGNRHVKFWYLDYSRSANYKESVPLTGRLNQEAGRYGVWTTVKRSQVPTKSLVPGGRVWGEEVCAVLRHLITRSFRRTIPATP
jgi:hypothetical protein